MKKALSLILALTLICGVFSACNTGKTPSESVGLAYEVNPDGKTCIITGIGTFTGTDLVIPSKIDGYSVTSIGIGAFNNCHGLKSITIPDSVTSIGAHAFSGTAYYDDNDNWSEGVLYIGNHLIEAQSDMISGEYTVKDGTKCIADDAFADCSSLTSITISDSVTSIGNWAFASCSGLTSITIPDSVMGIGYCAFSGTAYHDDNDNWSEGVLYIGNYLIEAQSDKLSDDYTVKEGTKCITGSAFGGCSKLTSITIPDSVTSISGRAFYGCSKLASITIPDSVTSIGYGMFSDCTELTSITVARQNAVYHSAGNCIIETGSKTLIAGCKNSVIPDDGSVTVIGGGAFAGCSGLTSIMIPRSVTSIGNAVFEGCCSLTSITVDSQNTVYHSVGNCIIETASKTLTAGCKNSVIPDDGSVTSIGNYAFYYCSGSIPYTGNGTITGDSEDSVESSDQTSTEIPDIGTITEDAEDLYEFSGETSTAVPNSVTITGDLVGPSQVSGLTSITIPGSVTSIGDYAFYGCVVLTSITFNGTMEQWNSIRKGEGWNSGTVMGWYFGFDDLKIHCTDGDLEETQTDSFVVIE